MAEQQVPESRAYRHLTCGEETIVTGPPFTVITNPLAVMLRTWCNHCNAYFPMDQYAWADSGEKITDYWARHGARATPLERFICSKTTMVVFLSIGVIAGGTAGYLFFRQKQVGIQIMMTLFIGGLGAFAMAAAFDGISKLIVWRVCGVTNTRVLK